MKTTVLVILVAVVPVLLLPVNHADDTVKDGKHSLPDEVQGLSNDDQKFQLHEIKLSPERQKRFVKTGIKFFYTISKTGVKWIWVKTKNGFRRLGKALDFLDRWYILGPMLFLEPDDVLKPDYYQYEDYDEEALTADGNKMK